jgi:hypothetical protein
VGLTTVLLDLAVFLTVATAALVVRRGRSC